MINNLEVVYYSKPTPSLKSLTLLSLVYDKIYFPGVFISEGKIDIKETIKSVREHRESNNLNYQLMANCMIYAMNYKYIKEFCIFKGKKGYIGTLEEGANDLAKQLEELIYGKPPKNFTPSFEGGFAIGIPGDKDLSLNSPSWLTYPPNALIFSIKNNIPLINDELGLPVPGIKSISKDAFKSNASLLMQILAIECIKFVFPNIKISSFEELSILRNKTKKYVKQFRLKVLELVEYLNYAITTKMGYEEVKREAKFIVDTKVYPELEELKELLKNKSKRWFGRLIFNISESAPEISLNFASMSTQEALGKTLNKLGAIFVKSIFNNISENKQIIKNGLYYLLKISDNH